MTDLGKFQLGPVLCSKHDIPQLLCELRNLLQDPGLKPRTILYTNAHVYNLAEKDEDLTRRLNAARINAMDGMGIVWAGRIFRERVKDRCNMTEAFRAFLQAPEFPPNTAVLIGCSQAEALTAAEKVNQISKHCRIVANFSGFHTDEEYKRVISEHADVNFFFIGMGTPRSEMIVEMTATFAPQAIIWAIGGGTIRIYAGTMVEAPSIWRQLGLQWLHRLLSEPSSVWKRYIVGNPLFVYSMFKFAVGQKFFGR